MRQYTSAGEDVQVPRVGIYWRNTSSNWENTTTLFRSGIDNAQRKTGEASPAGLTHGKATKMSSKA